VPSAAVQIGQNGQQVYVVKPDMTAQLRPVTIERTVDNDSVVTSGLKEGETVVVDGQFRVISGQLVEIKKTQGATVSAAPKQQKKSE
jgi:multidrug efflux system membrane fusion protein